MPALGKFRLGKTSTFMLKKKRARVTGGKRQRVRDKNGDTRKGEKGRGGGSSSPRDSGGHHEGGAEHIEKEPKKQTSCSLRKNAYEKTRGGLHATSLNLSRAGVELFLESPRQEKRKRGPSSPQEERSLSERGEGKE